jgi:hypothetical protein
MKRRAAELETQAAAAPQAPVVHNTPDTVGHSALAQRLVAAPHSREEAEERYVASRDAWTKAMRAASSGRPADLASLALTQEAYEAAAAERERWIAGGRLAVPVERAEPQRRIEAAVGQEMAWRAVKHHEEPKGFLGRLKKRIRG